MATVGDGTVCSSVFSQVRPCDSILLFPFFLIELDNDGGCWSGAGFRSASELMLLLIGGQCPVRSSVLCTSQSDEPMPLPQAVFG